MHIHMCECRCLCRSEEDIKYPRASVTDGSAVKQTQALWRIEHALKHENSLQPFAWFYESMI